MGDASRPKGRTTEPEYAGGARERIRDAAAGEFAAAGFAGARMDRIARHAKVNRALLYYYFGSKRALFQEAIRMAYASAEAAAGPAAEPLMKVLNVVGSGVLDPRAVRLLQWEALECPTALRDVVRKRRRAFLELAASFEGDPMARQKAWVIVSVALLPLVLPGLTRDLVGLSPASKQFVSSQQNLICRVAKILRERDQAHAKRQTHRGRLATGESAPIRRRRQTTSAD